MKSLLKSLYLFCLNLLPKSAEAHRVALVMSFADNDGGLVEQLYKQYQAEFILFYTPRLGNEMEKYRRMGITTYMYTSSNLLRGGFGKLKRCSTIIVDNYYAELSLLKGRQIIQYWHAIGAIKRFGWEDPKTTQRSDSDKRRFQDVYDSFSDIVVGSQIMGDIFVRSYKLPTDVIREIGVPRSDLLIQKNQNHAKAVLNTTLYVPTYRDTMDEMTAVIAEAIRSFAEFPGRKFMIKLHPEAVDKLMLDLPENVQLSQDHLADLYDQADSLISDYSSCVFDFNLRWPDRPILLFCPDIEEYERATGLQDYFKMIGNEQLVADANSLSVVLTRIDKIRNGPWLESWQTFNDGHSVERLMDLIKE